VSVHLALTPETRGFVGESVFREMKHGALFINTARAEIIDESALIAAMDSKAIRAGLDVFAGEPGGGEADYVGVLSSHPSVYGTHHIGASTDQAQEAVADEACRITLAYKAHGTVPNCVNVAQRSAADHTLVVRHKDRVGVLAAILGVLREDGINVQEMENVVFSGGAAACARIAIHGSPTESALTKMRGHDDVFSANVVKHDRPAA
jgi:D-3-phosphoglycerate dehydrogenase / 2-oxoglutarate reductase